MAHTPCVGLPTARRELRQAREGATVAKSECGRPLTFLWGRSFAGRLTLLGTLLIALAITTPAHAEPLHVLVPVLPTVLERNALELAVAPTEKVPAAHTEYPFLSGEDPSRSISLGDTSHGSLVNGKAIVESESLAILPEQKTRGLSYGSEELVAALEHAAKALHEKTGTKLWVGNVAAERGGDISYSVSHNSGRDADIAFCYQSFKGEPVDPPDLVPLNKSGLAASPPLKFDAARTWQVVKALMTYDGAQVQFLFISTPLREAILEAAREAGDDAMLIQKAATVLRQPLGAAAHNDHLHLRIYCGKRDVLGGCQNTGWAHPWVDLYEGDRDWAINHFATLLSDDDPAQRRSAVSRLALLDAYAAAKPVAGTLRDPDRDVRQAAAEALARIGNRKQVKALGKRFFRESDAQVKVALAGTIGDLGGKIAGKFLRRAVGKPQSELSWLTLGAAANVRGPALLSLLPAIVDSTIPTPSDDRSVQYATLAAAARAERLEPVGALVDLLSDRDEHVRKMSAHALRMTLNLYMNIDWGSDNPTHLMIGRNRWAAAHSRSKGAPRDAYLLTGFQAAGYKVPSLSQKHAWELIRAVGGMDHISFNAQRVLARLFRVAPPPVTWKKNDACLWWYKRINARRDSYRLKKPSGRVIRACYR